MAPRRWRSVDGTETPCRSSRTRAPVDEAQPSRDSPPPAGASLGWLALSFTLIALTASRITLVLHEFVGHGGLASLLGCRVTSFHLFLFGGGWIRYSRSEPFTSGEGLLVSLGGIAVELAFGTACLLWGRRQGARPRVRLVAVCVGLVDLLHAGYYVVVATHYGFGDGRRLGEFLGAGRHVLAVVGTLAVIALSYAMARELMRATAPFLSATSSSKRVGIVLAAAMMAALAHGGLMVGEQMLRADESYAKIMKPRSERQVEVELAKLQAKRRAEGDAPSAAELEETRERLRQELRPWPLRPVVVVGMLGGLLLGAYRTRVVHRDPPRRPMGLGLWAVCAAALGLVWLLRTPWWGT